MRHRAALLLALFPLLASTVEAQRALAITGYAVPDTGAVALAVPQGVPTTGAFAELDRRTAGALQRAVATAGFRGDRGTVLNLPGVGPYDQVLLVGTGTDPVSPRLLEDVGGLVGQAGMLSAAREIALLWPGATLPAAGAHLAFGASLGQYAFRQYKTPKPDAPVLGQGRLTVRVADAAAANEAWRKDWAHVADGVRFARDLKTEPGNVIYPETFVERTREAFEGVRGVSIEVVDEARMRELGMGAMLSVGGGSAQPPKLLLVRYRGAGDAAPIAFVGKGITFDSGGISIKPADNMWRMKHDMAGAAAATGAVLAMAKRGARVNAIAVAALAENMPDGQAARPGDVVRTLGGLTFENLNTDAEGRLVLVDAIAYVQRQDKPSMLIDIATLTGSQVTALGDEYGGLFSRDDALVADLVAAGTASGEELWRLPLHPSYAKDLESPIADLRNVGSGGRAGAGLGAHFIGAWVDPAVRWAHIDMASMAWRDDLPMPTVPTGATGYGVRLFDRFVRDHVEAAAD
ncbi:MAG: leucyl aminopeptidase [Lysobacteraceae bacterium]